MGDPRDSSFFEEDAPKDSRALTSRRMRRTASRSDHSSISTPESPQSSMFNRPGSRDMDLFMSPEPSISGPSSSSLAWRLPSTDPQSLGQDNWGAPLLPSSTLAPLPDFASFQTTSAYMPSLGNASANMGSASLLSDIDDWTLSMPLASNAATSSTQPPQFSRLRQSAYPLQHPSFSIPGPLPEETSFDNDTSSLFNTFRQSRDPALPPFHGRSASAPEYYSSVAPQSMYPTMSDPSYRYQGYAGDALPPSYPNPMEDTRRPIYTSRHTAQNLPVPSGSNLSYTSTPAGRSNSTLPPLPPLGQSRRGSMPVERSSPAYTHSSSSRPSTRDRNLTYSPTQSTNSASGRRMGTITSQNMQGLYTKEAIDRSFPGEWGDAFR